MVRLAPDESSTPLKHRAGTISTPFGKIFAIICLSPGSNEDLGRKSTMKIRLRMKWIICLLAGVGAITVIVCRLNNQRASLLIEQLAEKETGELAPHYSVTAYRQLQKMGLRAFDDLVRCVKDSRPAWETFQLASSGRTTVGQACFSIVAAQVEASIPRSSGLAYLRRQPDLQEWWQQRRGRTLGELQVEAIEWSLSELATNAAHYGSSNRSNLVMRLQGALVEKKRQMSIGSRGVRPKAPMKTGTE
jgi:hypothetical protein